MINITKGFYVCQTQPATFLGSIESTCCTSAYVARFIPTLRPTYLRQHPLLTGLSFSVLALTPYKKYRNTVSYSSRLQVIHRPGSGNCDRSRLMQYGCAWLPPGGKKLHHGSSIPTKKLKTCSTKEKLSYQGLLP
jgi:hypothetical protein